MRLLGASVVAVENGDRTLRAAVDEALRDWVSDPDGTYYCLGSAIGPHPYPLMVREFQAVIGREARAQALAQIGRLPDVVVACVGGGSNAMGIFDGFLEDRDVRDIGRFREVVEAAALAEAMARDRAVLAARLEENLDGMARAHRQREAKKLPELDAEFHRAIIELCGNPYLRAAYGLIEHKIHALRWRLPEHNEQVAHCQANHRVIVEQVRTGTVAKAQSTLREHIRDTYEAYRLASRSEVAIKARA